MYLESICKQFLYYKSLGEKAMQQLEPAQLLECPSEESNSIAVIIKHLWGNMRSRWTDFRHTDGEKPDRNRDGEFENDLADADAVWKAWNEGWAVFTQALDSIQESELQDIIYIRNEGHTILEALNRQLCHYPYHIGQIVFLAKLLKNGGFQSLSIPRNASQTYNAGKFAQEKQRKHFTDEK